MSSTTAKRSVGGGDGAIVRQIDGITVTMIEEGDRGRLRLAGVRQPPPGKSPNASPGFIELWSLRRGWERGGEVEAVPALFVPDRHGQAETTIADISGVETVMSPRSRAAAARRRPASRSWRCRCPRRRNVFSDR